MAKSIERIHKANLINFGLLPLTFVNGEDYDTIEEMDELLLSDIYSQLRRGNRVSIANKTKGVTFDASCDLSSREKEVLFAGGALLLRQSGTT